MLFQELCTINIFRHSKAKRVDQSVWNRLGWNPNRVKYTDVFHQKAQCTRVNEHFETLFNAGMAKRSNRQGLKMTRAKLLFRFSVIWLLLFSATSMAENNNKTSQQLENVKSEIQSLNQDVNKNKSSKAKLYAQLRKQSRTISRLNKDLLSLKQKIANQDKELNGLQQQVKHQQSSHLQQLNGLNQQIRRAYIQGRPSFLKILLNQNDPATLSRSSTYFHYFNQARQQRLDQISDTLANLSTEQKRLYQAQKQLYQLYKQQQQKQQKLHQQTGQRQVTLKLLEAKIKDQDSRLSQLHKQEQSLQLLLQSLNKVHITKNKTTIKSSSFAQHAGSLPWPMKGKILARYGSSRNIGKLTWQGILIGAPTGKNIIAVAQGKVVFADWLRGFGLLLIIDHGNQYMTLYGNNETLLKQAGDTVSTGELIAQSGDKGVHQHAGLYFEIRHKGSPTNPLKWLSKHS